MPSETMTPKERWLAVLRREKPDRVPMDYWATPEASAKLIKHMGLSRKSEGRLAKELSSPGSEMWIPPQGAMSALYQALKVLHVDHVVSLKPNYTGPGLPENMDVFGCTYRDINYGSGTYREVMTHPLALYKTVAEIQAEYRWPDPDWWNYSQIAEQADYWVEYPLRGGGSEPFLIYKDLRGDALALMDLIENPDIVEYCLDRLFELAYQNTQRIIEAVPGRVDLTYVAEDMGGQDNLMFSKNHIRRFLLPGMKRIINLSKQAGAYVFHHNDGSCRPILQDMIELGIDILNPIQWRSNGMDRVGLKRDFGDRLIFHGAVDNQYTLPFGSPKEVRQEVIDNIEILGANGGYIIAPCHNIQPVSPPENIIAMYQAGFECGWG